MIKKLHRGAQMNQEKFTNTESAAKALEVSRNTVSRWCATGFISNGERTIGPGRQQWLVPIDEVNRIAGSKGLPGMEKK